MGSNHFTRPPPTHATCKQKGVSTGTSQVRSQVSIYKLISSSEHLVVFGYYNHTLSVCFENAALSQEHQRTAELLVFWNSQSSKRHSAWVSRVSGSILAATKQCPLQITVAATLRRHMELKAVRVEGGSWEVHRVGVKVQLER